ncbi:hypothetical protein [Ruegeria arenilitoris]|uniref:hypothetical protein n=1 Tax=Ruegeria arenilitoris TaxID=1173585 RepID=UPI0014810775|nr:hypothetical protein [Ruegeria arenilitoris]
MSLSTILEVLGLPATLEVLVAINVVSIVYLIWYAWYLFIANKGDPGALGLAIAAMAFFNVVGEGADMYEDWQDEKRRTSATQNSDVQSE